MSVLYIALPIALLLGGGGLLACLYCIRDGQYDDLDSPSVRILVDEHRVDEDAQEPNPPRTLGEASAGTMPKTDKA
ncbi:cbb3-type cytochrome oxidase assembly protein CcoS [Stieleria sp.]|uniref:cbb3-type cytochrome oxidase assembly protein CcoS n=1 Tax=Stieleria sp. TaxID=2795976 RepID=UPI003562E19E